MINRASVFIPIISPRDEAVGSETSINTVKTRLIEVYSEPSRIVEEKANSVLTAKERKSIWSVLEHKAIEKYWDLVAAPLRVCSPVLYKSGCTAVSAVRKMQLKKPRMGFFQLFKPDAAIAAQRLYSVSTIGPTEGSSSELGLAIALATSLCNIQEYVIVATGALSESSSVQSSPLIRQGDVKIHPVAQIKEKLVALASDVTAGVFAEISRNKKILVFTPKYYKQDDEEFEVYQIPEVQRLKSLGVTVIPVNWLSEAFNALHAYRTQYLFQDRLILTLLGMFFVFSLVYYSWVTWLDSHIPMQFIQTGQHHLPSEPFELCLLGKLQYALPIAKYSSIPTLSVASTIAWKTSIGDPNSIDAFLAEQLNYQGYYIIVIVVSEFSPISFDYVRSDNTNSPIRIRPGDSFEGWMKLNDTAEVNILMLLAQRFALVDIEQLRTSFNERFTRTNVVFSQKINVDAVSDFFAGLVPGSLVYPFLTVMEKSKCVY